MNLRWYKPDEGEPELQVETMFGWEAVPVVTEAEERQRERESEELMRHVEERICRDMIEAAMSYQQRRALKDFDPT